MHLSASPSSTRSGSLMLLAPLASAVPGAFHGVDVDPGRHAHVLAGVQKLRGSVYLRDGAITAAQLTSSGQHVLASDDSSWHVVSIQPDGEIAACARFRTHQPQEAEPEALGVWSSAIARSATWADRLRVVLANDLALARARRVRYVEFGGWAVGEEFRRTAHAVNTAMSTYALAESLGGFLGVTTATVKHCSSRIMRKLGGHSFEWGEDVVPSYFDEHYGCEMELLRFDSSLPSRKYGLQVSQYIQTLQHLPVLCAGAGPGRAGAAGHGRRPAWAALAGRHVHCFAGGGLATA
ncbi:MAG: hypothetical protein H0V80_17085 [Acidobacteria bacterium]|nr:hypothetical protein [Acidobacteriota bacterium]